MAKSGGKGKGGGKKKKKVESVFLVCEETGDYNYTIRRKPSGEKLKLRKYCPRLRRHTLHVEKRK
jgi:large subunit ribosomal protein L33